MKKFLAVMRGIKPEDNPEKMDVDKEDENSSEKEDKSNKWDDSTLQGLHGRFWALAGTPQTYPSAPASTSGPGFGAMAKLAAAPMAALAAAPKMAGVRRARNCAGPPPALAFAACAPAPCAAPCAAAAPGGGGAIGFKTGGAQDAENFRENIKGGHLPLPTDVTYEGVIKDYFFDTSSSDAPPCTELFCPAYSLALAPDPLLAASSTATGASAAGTGAGTAATQQAQQQQRDVFLAVGLDSGITDFRRPRLNLVILLDVSGSMDCRFNGYYYDAATGQRRQLEGPDAGRTKLDVAKEVMCGMLDKLGPEDSFAISLFSDGVATPKRMGQVAHADLAGIKAGINRLRTVGCTNFQAGLDEATEQLRSHPDCIDGDPATTENRIIVLTDAETNSGDISEAGLLSRLKANSADRFYMTIVGVGLDFNTQLIEKIMKCKGANYFSVHTPGEFRQRLADEFDFMVAPLVFDLELRVDPASLAHTAQHGVSPAQQEEVPTGQQAQQAPPAAQQEQGQGQEQAAEQQGAAAAGPQEQQGQGQDQGEVAAAPSGGWKVVHVYGSPDSEERRLSGGGSIMRIHTLFPSPKTEEGIKGGVVLLRMQPPPGTTASTAPPLRLAARYADRAGQQYNTLRTVLVPPQAAEAATAVQGFFQSSGVRKAVALARLVDALQCWLVDEWAAAEAGGNSSTGGWNEEAVFNVGLPPINTPTAPPTHPTAVLPETPAPTPTPHQPLLRAGCPLLPPPPPPSEGEGAVPGTPFAPRKLGRRERASKPLKVNAGAKAALRQLLPFLEAEVAAVGDSDMRQEVELLQRLLEA